MKNIFIFIWILAFSNTIYAKVRIQVIEQAADGRSLSYFDASLSRSNGGIILLYDNDTKKVNVSKSAKKNGIEEQVWTQFIESEYLFIKDHVVNGLVTDYISCGFLKIGLTKKGNAVEEVGVYALNKKKSIAGIGEPFEALRLADIKFDSIYNLHFDVLVGEDPKIRSDISKARRSVDLQYEAGLSRQLERDKTRPKKVGFVSRLCGMLRNFRL